MSAKQHKENYTYFDDGRVLLQTEWKVKENGNEYILHMDVNAKSKISAYNMVLDRVDKYMVNATKCKPYLSKEKKAGRSAADEHEDECEDVSKHHKNLQKLKVKLDQELDEIQAAIQAYHNNK